MGELGDESDVSRLTQLLKSHDLHTIWRAAKALSRMQERGINVEKAESSLKSALENNSLRERRPFEIKYTRSVIKQTVDDMRTAGV